MALEASTRLICNAADITTNGGDADGVAGQGGDLQGGVGAQHGLVRVLGVRLERVEVGEQVGGE